MIPPIVLTWLIGCAGFYLLALSVARGFASLVVAANAIAGRAPSVKSVDFLPLVYISSGGFMLMLWALLRLLGRF